MVQVYLYEECAASELASSPLMQDLANEGIAMLLALAQDFGKLQGVRTHLFLNKDYSAEIPRQCNFQIIWLESNPDDQLFNRHLSSQDRLIIIAPECENILATRTRQATSGGITVLGSNCQAIAETSDKIFTFHRLQKHNIPTPFTCLLSNGANCSVLPFPRVIKPLDGAGATNTFKINNQPEWDQFLLNNPNIPGESFIVQPWTPGTSCSICLFVDNVSIIPVMSSYQNIQTNFNINYLGGSSPLIPTDFTRAASLAIKAVKAFPGLAFWVGVDLVLGETPDGSNDSVLEINPRLTTSYLGARHLAAHNLASYWLGAIPIPHIPETITTKVLFDKKGNIIIG